jgi:hypothetical protein
MITVDGNEGMSKKSEFLYTLKLEYFQKMHPDTQFEIFLRETW